MALHLAQPNDQAASWDISPPASAKAPWPAPTSAACRAAPLH